MRMATLSLAQNIGQASTKCDGAFALFDWTWTRMITLHRALCYVVSTRGGYQT
jgi:hypothetical protein